MLVHNLHSVNNQVDIWSLLLLKSRWPPTLLPMCFLGTCPCALQLLAWKTLTKSCGNS